MVFLTAWHAALGVVTVFTGFWIFMFVNTLPYSVTLWWDTYIVSSLFSAVLFVYAVTREAYYNVAWRCNAWDDLSYGILHLRVCLNRHDVEYVVTLRSKTKLR